MLGLFLVRQTTSMREAPFAVFQQRRIGQSQYRWKSQKASYFIKPGQNSWQGKNHETLKFGCLCGNTVFLTHINFSSLFFSKNLFKKDFFMLIQHFKLSVNKDLKCKKLEIRQNILQSLFLSIEFSKAYLEQSLCSCIQWTLHWESYNFL